MPIESDLPYDDIDIYDGWFDDEDDDYFDDDEDDDLIGLP